MTADKSPRKDSAGRPDENFEPYELHGKMPWPLIAIAVGLGIWGAATLFDTREDVAAARDERIAESRVATGAGTEPGSALFVARCSTCHQPDGMGVRGAIPPLAGSAFVAQGPELVSTILLRGIDGPIRGFAQWQLTPEGAGTRLDFDQQVEAVARAFRWASYVARPVLAANHTWMMRGAERGLAARLAAAAS